ncbi:unnamed protein product [Lepeophtheirus salmonis]|uniref:(salmon louse) hypothetical protein n=1 Tax=Lepeophtheirus salmonis TaxID=72036 RepID=A0A817FBJ4_LEPSM|nr:unnamed protein product [Lepeophtheirus salmonis]CAG9476075.1 unnamed protein product [Lepeophtheirus salmonis]
MKTTQHRLSHGDRKKTTDAVTSTSSLLWNKPYRTSQPANNLCSSKSAVSTAKPDPEQVLVECDLPETLFASQDPKASHLKKVNCPEADLYGNCIQCSVPPVRAVCSGMSEHECLNESVYHVVRFNAPRFGNDRRRLASGKAFDSKKHSEAKAISSFSMSRCIEKSGKFAETRECSQCPVHCMNRFEALEEVRDTMAKARECIVEPAAKASYKQALLRKAEGIVEVGRRIGPSWFGGSSKEKSVLEEAKPPPEEVLTEWESVFLAPSVKDSRNPVAIIDPMDVLMNEATIRGAKYSTQLVMESLMNGLKRSGAPGALIDYVNMFYENAVVMVKRGAEC